MCVRVKHGQRVVTMILWHVGINFRLRLHHCQQQVLTAGVESDIKN